MKKSLTMICLIGLGTVATAAVAEEPVPGKDLFKKSCAMCHPNGGNIIKKDKTLKEDILKKNGLNTREDIVNFMRKPGSGMTAFDEAKLPQKDAEAIAEYIMATFK